MWSVRCPCGTPARAGQRGAAGPPAVAGPGTAPPQKRPCRPAAPACRPRSDLLLAEACGSDADKLCKDEPADEVGVGGDALACPTLTRACLRRRRWPVLLRAVRGVVPIIAVHRGGPARPYSCPPAHLPPTPPPPTTPSTGAVLPGEARQAAEPALPLRGHSRRGAAGGWVASTVLVLVRACACRCMRGGRKAGRPRERAVGLLGRSPRHWSLPGLQPGAR